MEQDYSPVITVELTEKEIEKIREMALNHPHPFLRRRGMVLLLHSRNSPSREIGATLGICENTVRNCLHAYREGGLEKLSEIRFYRPQSELKPFESQITEYLRRNPPSTLKQACSEIADLTGIHKKESAMRLYLKSLGISYRKVGGIPAKADIKAQESFKTEKLEPRLEESRMGKRDVYFVDSAHFVLGAFLGFLWSFTRIFVKTPSGRQRFNVLGALHAITHELITITNTTYITSVEVGELLKQLAQKATHPITLVLDNARYQRCRYVTDLASSLSIELLFLPPYSPNLNLIERLWKLVKKRCLNSKYHSDFQVFRAAITDFLEHMNERHADELSSLLTLNFQTFSQEQILKAA